jgi:hypothetical protein
VSNEYEFPQLPLGCYVETSKRGVKFETHSKAGVLAYTKSCVDPLLAEIFRLTRELAEAKARAIQIVRLHRNDYNGQQIDPILEALHSAFLSARPDPKESQDEEIN